MSGFKKLEGPSSSKLDLTRFEGHVGGDEPMSREDIRIADRVAERNSLPGEPVGRVQLNRGRKVNDRIFVQGPITTLNRFRLFCNDQDVPLHKGLEMLLDQFESQSESGLGR
jgi:hypothetical protein